MRPVKPAVALYSEAEMLSLHVTRVTLTNTDPGGCQATLRT